MLETIPLNSLPIRRGQVFCNRNSATKLGDLIGIGQRWISPEKREDFQHTGFIADDKGTTWEQRKRLGYFNLSDYIGQEICILSCDGFTPELFDRAHAVSVKRKGKPYPVFRLLLFLIPPLARRLNIGFRVCSEEVAWHFWYSRYLIKDCARVNEWKGVYPDMLYQWAFRRRGWRVDQHCILGKYHG